MSGQPTKPKINLDNVDIDQIDVEILIICKNPASFQQSGTFLSRRGWPTTVVGTLSKAVELILKNHPDIIFISMNHPNPGVLKLPSLVESDSSLSSICIAFAEGNDVTTAARLQSVPVSQRMQGLPSGPNIERFVRKIISDRVESEKRKMSPIDANVRPPGSQFQKKPVVEDKDMIDMGTYKVAKKKEKVKFKDVKSVNVADPAAEIKKKTDAVKSDLLNLGKANVRGESGMMLLPTKAENDPSGQLTLRVAREKGEDEPNLIQKGIRARKKLNSTQLEEMKRSRFSMMQPGAKGSKEFNLVAEGAKSKIYEVKEGSANQPNAVNLSRGERELGVVKVSGKLAKEPIEKFHLNLMGLENFGHHGDSFDKPIDIVINKTAVAGESVSDPLAVVQCMQLIAMENAGNRGIFVICSTKENEDKLAQFAIEYRKQLEQHFMEIGMKAVLKEPQSASAAPFLFAEWSKAETALCYRINHHGNEFGVGFVAANKKLPQARQTDDEDMLQIAIKDIDLSAAIPFKAYIFFKKSEKYFLYVRNGRQLSASQQQRLLAAKTEDFFIKIKDVSLYDDYIEMMFVIKSTLKYPATKAA